MNQAEEHVGADEAAEGQAHEPSGAENSGAEEGKSGSESLNQAQEMGKKALNEAKAATKDAFSATKVLITDPMGGQRQAIEALGPSKTLPAGLVFMALFALIGFLMVSLHMGKFLSAGQLFRIFLGFCIPPAALFGGFLLVGKIFSKEATLHNCIFTAGVALLPMAIALLIGGLLGGSFPRFAAAIFFFATCITVLLINSALLDVYRLTTRHGVILTPSLLLLSMVIGYLIGAPM